MRTAIDRGNQNEGIFTRLLSDDEFASLVKAHVIADVYERINATTAPADWASPPQSAG